MDHIIIDNFFIIDFSLINRNRDYLNLNFKIESSLLWVLRQQIYKKAEARENYF